jgi:hypothetical protein
MNLKSENQDIVKSLISHVLFSWEERFQGTFVKKSDADSEFSFFRNGMAAADRQQQKLEKMLEYFKDSLVTHAEFERIIA